MKTATIIAMIWMISLASAIFPGETQTIDFSSSMDSIQNITYETNSSVLVEIFNTSANVTIPASSDLTPFEIVFTISGEKEEQVIIHSYSSSSGGSSSSKTIPHRTIGRQPNMSDFLFFAEEPNQINLIDSEEEEQEKLLSSEEDHTLLYIGLSILGILITIGIVYSLSREKHLNPQNF